MTSNQDQIEIISDLSADALPLFLARLQERHALSFHDLNHLQLALTHKSYRNEHRGLVKEDNERLEFLGDAVLSLVLSDLLMRSFSDQSEGVLSIRRASLVNETTLAEIAAELNLAEVMKLGKGEEASGGARKPRLLASTLEALFAAVYRDQGLLAVSEFISQLYSSRLNNFSETTHFQKDYKTRLQEMMQQQGRAVPNYLLVSSEGPEHEKIFCVQVQAGADVLGTGHGRSKKYAEQEAARAVIANLESVNHIETHEIESRENI